MPKQNSTCTDEKSYTVCLDYRMSFCLSCYNASRCTGIQIYLISAMHSNNCQSNWCLWIIFSSTSFALRSKERKKANCYFQVGMKEPIQSCCRETRLFRGFHHFSCKSYAITGFEEATITHLLYLGLFWFKTV